MRFLLKPFFVLLIAVVVVSIIQTVITRPISDFFALLKIIVPFSLFMFANGYTADEDVDKDGKVTRYYPTFSEAAMTGVFGFFLMTVITVVILSIYSSAVDCIEWISNPTLDDYLVTAITCISVLFFGSALFMFRTYKRTLYGLTEVVAGLVVSVNYALKVFHSSNPDLSLVLAILTAGVYLVVRGMDNAYEGSKIAGNLTLQLENEVGLRKSK